MVSRAAVEGQAHPAPVRGFAKEGRSALWEALLLATVLTMLVWQFQGLRGSSASDNDDRYLLDRQLRPNPVAVLHGPQLLATLCHRLTLSDRATWLWKGACVGSKANLAGEPEQMLALMQAEHDVLQAAIAQGLTERQRRLSPLVKSAAEGVLPAAELEHMKAALREIARYREYYRPADGGSVASLPLACAWRELRRGIETAPDDAAGALWQASAVALLMGHAERLWLAPEQSELAGPAGSKPECVALGPPTEVIGRAAALVQRVRFGGQLEHKAQAMERLQRQAPWLLVGWAALTWFCLSLARVTNRLPQYLGLVLVLWAGAGAASGLVWPKSGLPMPWWLWTAAVVCGGILLALGRTADTARWLQPSTHWRSVTFLSLPVWVGCVGFGWWLAFDLAINGHFRNRYIALAQQLPVFAAFMLLALMPVFAFGIARIWVVWSSLVTNALRPRGGRLRGWWQPLRLWLIYLMTFLGLAVLLGNWPWFTGEVFRCWLVMGVAWFFMLRGERLSTASGWAGLVPLLPLLGYVLVVMFALLVTKDLGPLLVVLLSGAVYAGGFVASTVSSRGAAWPVVASSGLLATMVVTAGLLGGMAAFSTLPWGPAERVAQRLESVFNPFSAENDQLAHVKWFQGHVPEQGYGLGSVPWCGTMPAASCPGMPAQTQSDYTFSAVQGVAGPARALGLLAVYLLWLGWLAARQAAQTKGVLQPQRPEATEGAWLAWLAICWAAMVMVQTLVTVLGNLGAMPLTGVTWPFVSWGTWSLLVNTFVLGLVMHRLEDRA